MKKKNLDNNMNSQFFNDEYEIEKCKILYCLEDKKLLEYTNHTEYSDTENTNYVRSIKNSLKKLILTENNIIERQYNKSGCNRIYCKGFGLQYFSNNILQFILPVNSCEYDMKNCNPQILLYLYKKHQLDYNHLEYYCNNRDTLLKKHNLKKTDINTLTNQDHPKKQNILWLEDLIQEVNKNKPLLFSFENDKINKEYQKLKQNESKNFLSSMCCSIVFYYENEILQKAISKYKCIVPKYDGFLTNQDIDINELNDISKEYDVKWDKKHFDINITETTYDNDLLNKLLYPQLVYPHSFNTTLQLAKTIQNEIKKELIFCNNKWYIYHNKLWITIKNPNYSISNFINNELDKTLEEKLKEKDIDIDEEKNTFNKVKQTLDKSAFMNALIKNLELLLLDDKFTDKFDKTEFKFVFENGIYDIKNKTFRKDILKSEYISKTLPFDYNPTINKENREWILKELLKICNMNEKHLEYYLSILAFCLCGVPHMEQEIYCLIGQGASNGKTIALEALMDIFEIYITKGDTKIFESDCAKKHKYLIDYYNTTNRIVICNEFDDKKEVDAKIFKEIADGETIKNEIMFGTSVKAKINAKPIIIGNYTLKFDKQDKGIERRYKHLQFNTKFCDKDELEEEDSSKLQFFKDKSFKQKLIDKKHEFIDIIIEYANNYFINEKLPTIPDEFKEEQNEVLNANNDFMNWFSDVPKNIGDDQYCSAVELFTEYNIYAKNNNLDTITKQRNLNDKMKQYAYKYDRLKMINKKRGAFQGFSIIKENDSDSD
tara:strand:+ start:2583 stop:4904 length:2322 start_codon:yes stop_codon:yes gene_type:complete